MVVGSGLIASAFRQNFQERDDVIVYAAGVSNSGCRDTMEFEREEKRLVCSIEGRSEGTLLIYFSTCSIADNLLKESPYVEHKLRMESLVAELDNFLIIRLPQVAGKTPNPHTLLNYLYARISRSEKLRIWRDAFRNIIDVDDVAKIVEKLVDDSVRNRIVNVANPESIQVVDLVYAMERVVGKKAVFEIVNGGSGYDIDISPIVEYLAEDEFDETYIESVLRKYYREA